MADSRAKKLSQLPVINSVSSNDLIYIVHNGNSYAVNAATMGLGSSLTFLQEGSVNVTSNGTNNILWYQFSNTYCGAKIYVDAYNATENARTFGELHVGTLNNVSNSITDVVTFSGSNGVINLVSVVNVSSGNTRVYLSMSDANSSANIQIRYSTSLFKI